MFGVYAVDCVFWTVDPKKLSGCGLAVKRGVPSIKKRRRAQLQEVAHSRIKVQ